MLDLIFWCVVGLYLLYGYGEFRRERDLNRLQNANILRMETINGPQDQNERQGQG